MQVKVKDWNINYETVGEGEPIIFLHGWLTDLETMRPLANSLSQNFKCYLVDVVGFGKSDLPKEPLNTDGFGDFLKAFVEALNIKNPILIGHSNGGRTILNAAGRNLFSVKKIVLIDSGGIKPKRKLKYYLKVGFYKTGKFFLNILPQTERVEKFKEKLMSRVGSSDYRNSPQVLKETLKNIVNEDQRKILPNIKAPTLLIWGGLDRDTPISDAKIIESLIPDCGLVEYPYGTHFSYLENLNNVNIVLNKFLV